MSVTILKVLKQPVIASSLSHIKTIMRTLETSQSLELGTKLSDDGCHHSSDPSAHEQGLVVRRALSRGNLSV
jgi:hypothetical protein